MAGNISQKVYALFEQGKLPQEIAEALGVPIRDVVDSLKGRLGLAEDDVPAFAERERAAHQAVESMKERLGAAAAGEGGRADNGPGRAPKEHGAAIPIEEYRKPAEPPPPLFEERDDRGWVENMVDAPELQHSLIAILRNNLFQLERGLVPLPESADFETPLGRPDIVADDRHGQTVIVRFAAGEATHEDLAMLLAHMGALEERMRKNVRGMLVARSFPQTVLYAARVVPAVKIKAYTLNFNFEEL